MDLVILNGGSDLNLELLTTVDGIVVMIADIIAVFVLLYIYRRNKRKSALLYSVAWMFDFLTVLSSAGGYMMVSAIFLTIFSSMVLYGSIKFLEEESIRVSYRDVSFFIYAPVALILYIFLVYLFTKNAEWVVTGALSLSIATITVTFSGMLLRKMREIYQNAIRYFYISMILFGLHMVPGSLFGFYQWYLPVGFTLSAILIVFMILAMMKLLSSETFMKQEQVKIPEINLKPGVILLSSSEYQKLKESLKGIPALAFLRDVIDVPEKWDYYFVTTVPFQGRFKNTVSPTDLGRMTELIYRYFEEFSKSGHHGIVIIDCLEYLTVYNSTESILKFLSKLRDFAVVNNGTLILVIEEESLDKRIFAQLRKIVG